jgi:hypothetical protein
VSMIFRAGTEALTAVSMKSSIICDITPYNELIISQRFAETCRLHLQP